jgi:uncharacterized protein (TIGR00251 family)
LAAAGWYRKSPSGWLLTIHLQPGAKRSAVAGLHGDALKIRIAAPPLEGRANAALEAFIAKALGIAKSKVVVIKGLQSREKIIAVNDTDADPAALTSDSDGAPQQVAG